MRFSRGKSVDKFKSLPVSGIMRFSRFPVIDVLDSGFDIPLHLEFIYTSPIEMPDLVSSLPHTSNACIVFAFGSG